MTTTTRNDYGSQTPPLEKLNTGDLSLISRLANKFLADHNLDTETKHCPRCDRNRLKKFFGIRVMREPKTGKPLKARFQSYCTDCRSLKPGQKPETKKGAKAKKSGQAKVRAQVKAGKAKVEAPAVEPAPVVLGDEGGAAPSIEIPVVAAAPVQTVETELAPVAEPVVVVPEFVPEVVVEVAAQTMAFVPEVETVAPVETVLATIVETVAE